MSKARPARMPPAANGGQIERIDAGGGNRFVYKTSNGADNPDISPDSKWVLFSAFSEGQHRIMRMPIEGGDVQILTDYRANEPRYSRDGTRIITDAARSGRRTTAALRS